MTAPDRLWSRAQAYLASGQAGPARAALDALLARDPTHVHAHLVLGGIAWKGDRMRDATRHALDAARVVPDEPLLQCAVIAALLQVGESATARTLLQQIMRIDTGNGGLLMQLAGLQNELGDHAQALRLYERAHAAGVDGPQFRYQRATQLAFNGRLSEAESELEQCVATGVPLGRAYVELARQRRQTVQRNHLPMLDRMMSRVPPGSKDHAGLEFARYKELEDLGRHDEAWEALARGNAVMAARNRHDAAGEQRLFDALLSQCTPDFLQPESVDQQGPRPIFVIGMTRSGTTVLDRMLGNHTLVTSAGELRDFGWQLRWSADSCTPYLLDERIVERLPKLDFTDLGRRYLAQTQWRAQERPWYVDKLPSHWQVAGLIARALPQARIVHLVRDPMDVCFSNWRVLFGDSYAWSYDLEQLAARYRQYQRVMAHWHAALPGRILDVAYADLVRDPEPTLRKVFDFCGIPEEKRCTDLTRNQNPVATLSMVQVRSPLHARAFEEWRPYAAQLDGLRRMLAED